MHKKWLRLYLEPRPGTSFEGREELRDHADYYLNPIGAKYAGYGVCPASYRRYNGQEPMWQYIIWDHSDMARERALHVAKHSLVPGYRVIVLEKVALGENETVIG